MMCRFSRDVMRFPDPATETLRFLAALFLYGLFYAAFFLQSFLSGNYIAPSDSLDFGVADYLSSPALWTQGMYSGYPIVADPQALTWYPVLRLFRALGADWNIFLIAAYVIASARPDHCNRLRATAVEGWSTSSPPPMTPAARYVA